MTQQDLFHIYLARRDYDTVKREYRGLVRAARHSRRCGAYRDRDLHLNDAMLVRDLLPELAARVQSAVRRFGRN